MNSFLGDNNSSQTNLLVDEPEIEETDAKPEVLKIEKTDERWKFVIQDSLEETRRNHNSSSIQV